MLSRTLTITIIFLTSIVSSCSQINNLTSVEYTSITTGAQNLISSDLVLIKNKKIGVVANQSSVVNDTQLVDTLIALNIDVVKIFSPEHGFRGKAEAGASIKNGLDTKTGIEVISLYGNHKKPTHDDLNGIDIVIFDLQDVGARFYTYISTLTYVMEACAEYNIPLLVLDRPNPNGFYVDGPVLDTAFSSFVGLHSIPIVYGMSIGEYALMVNGERWLKNGIQCDLDIIQLSGYHHNMIFELPVPPSPNLPTWQSVYLYPSLCLFEGTIMSIGRGTDYPFQVYGHPQLTMGSFAFRPKSIPGVSVNPKFKDIDCFGQNLKGYAKNYEDNPLQLNLSWLINAYHILSKHDDFFSDYFEKLAGTDQLRKQIEAGMDEDEIRATWQKDLREFRKIRKKYLLYD